MAGVPRICQESDSNQTALQPLAEREKRAETVFGQTPTTEPTIATIDTSNLLAYEGNPILQKRVIGKDDVDIAAMIQKLGNSDWVRQGRSFYEVNDRACPFCQQSTDESFARSLNDYFDEAFTVDSKAIDDLVVNHNTESERVQQHFAAIFGSPSMFLDIEKLKSEKELLDAKITLNNQRLARKKKSQVR